MRRARVLTSAVLVTLASPAQGCWRFALDWEEIRKTQGARDDEFSSVLEHRTTALIAWGMSDQPGTGATDWFVGLSGSHQLNPKSALFASAQYRDTGRNDAGYKYGRSVLLNLAYEHKIGARWDAVLELNQRDAHKDEIDSSGDLDVDTGGAITYLNPRLLFDVGGGWVLRASAQLPLSQSGLDGIQHEEPVLNLGVTRLFNGRTN